MGEGAGAGGGEAQHLKPVRERAGMAAFAAIFDIVMDWVVVGRNRLEGGEIGLGDGAAGNVEALADRQILEKPALRKPVLPPVESLAVGHVLAPAAASMMRHQERQRRGRQPHSIGRPPVTGIIAPVM